MSRRYPSPFWREQTRCYYVQIGKKQHRLDPDQDESFRLYHALMQQPLDAAVSTTVLPRDPLVVEILDAFLSSRSTSLGRCGT